MSGMKEEPPMVVVEEPFVEQARRSSVLREEIAHYDRVDRTHPDRSYDFVMKIDPEVH